jgi:hypothetical protein
VKRGGTAELMREMEQKECTRQPDVACAEFPKAGPVTKIAVEGRCHESILAAGSRVKFPRNSLGK